MHSRANFFEQATYFKLLLFILCFMSCFSIEQAVIQQCIESFCTYKPGVDTVMSDGTTFFNSIAQDECPACDAANWGWQWNQDLFPQFCHKEPNDSQEHLRLSYISYHFTPGFPQYHPHFIRPASYYFINYINLQLFTFIYNYKYNASSCDTGGTGGQNCCRQCQQSP